MNKEIKFRAWDKIKKVMIYEAIGLGEGSVLVDEATQQGNELVWQQYTGLKDKNEKEIYEGDIVKKEIEVGILHKEVATDIRVIVWQSERARFGAGLVEFGKETKIRDSNLPPIDEKEFEVIGNIYEHKHLIDNIDTKV